MAKKPARKLEYHDRFALQQADQAIRKDIIRALVEIVTNSDDSYQRLENAGLPVQGEIIIDVQRKRKNSLFRVRDRAEGMSGEKMDEMVGTYGAPTSGFIEGRSVRGLWGRGLKDAFYGIGNGHIHAIHNGYYYHSRLFIRDGTPLYEPSDAPVYANLALRKKYEIPVGNGTVIELVLSRPDVPVPQIDSVRFKLQQHFELRRIMANANRRLLLRELDSRGRIREEYELSYRAPKGIQIYDEWVDIPESPAQVHLEVYRSDEPLSRPAEQGDYADGGLLVVSKGVVLTLTMLKFAHNEFANRIYGAIVCDYLHDLLQQEVTEPILSATRDGVNWNHPFMRALRLEIEAKLEPLILAERRYVQSHTELVLDKRLRKRFNTALRRLNSMAKQVLVAKSSSRRSKPTRPSVPFKGFGFVKEFANVQTGRTATLTVRARLPKRGRAPDAILVSSDNPEVRLTAPAAALLPRADYPDIAEALVRIEARQVGAEGVVTAQWNGLSAEALIKVVSRPARKEESAGGFFTKIDFSANVDPKQRVTFDLETGTIVVAVTAPSVAPYLGEGGIGADTPQGQVVLAELVTEAVCREIARRGVQSGRLPSFHDNMSDSIQYHFQQLQHEFSGQIHEFFVDPKYRRATSEQYPVSSGGSSR